MYLGPISGGIKPPAILKSYFKKESFIHKLRNLDTLILKLPVYKKQFAKLEKVLVCFDYVEDILPNEYLKRKKNLLDIGIDCSQFSQAVNNDIPKILYVGARKDIGVELLIRAIEKIKDLNFVLDILGDGEEKENF